MIAIAANQPPLSEVNKANQYHLFMNLLYEISMWILWWK